MTNRELKIELLPGQMTREQALDKANQIVAEWTGQVKNERGYVHDRWQPADPATRTEAVLRLAAFLLGPERLPLLQAPGGPPHLHRASCDGTVGERLCGYPDGPTISSPKPGWDNQ